MAESDERGKSRTSPVPELNPLLHPILNQNLSRWAEVYFRNPPEKRDEAVLQLLEELEREYPQPELATAPPPAFQPQPDELSRESTLPTGPRLVCQSCGFVARQNQKFCGRCGTRLGNRSQATDVWPPHEPGEPVASPWELGAPAVPAAHADSGPESAANRQGSAGIDLENGRGEVHPGQNPESAPMWYSHRHFIAAGFAFLIVILLLLLWPGGKTAPQSSSRPQPASAVTTSPSSSPAHAQEAVTGGRPAADHSAPPRTIPSGRATGTDPEIQPQGGRGVSSPPASATESLSPTPEQILLAQPLSANGSQELAIALEFLDGTGGRQVNRSEAADWLWKSVSKRNTAASLVLARLYLQGDGVPKNCDQGRILLDIAAKRGSKEASSMLQNLQGFGCP